MRKPTVVVPLVAGFEEIEAVTLIDVLRRAGVTVRVAGVEVGPVLGSHDIAVQAEVALAGIAAADVDMMVLPGGMPGAAHLSTQPDVQRLLKEVADAGGYTSAICAAPIALAAAGLHRGKTVTCYPGFEEQLEGGELVEDRVVIDGKVATSRGPGTALEFALTLAGLLRGPEVEAELTRAMLVVRPAPARLVR